MFASKNLASLWFRKLSVAFDATCRSLEGSACMLCPQLQGLSPALVGVVAQLFSLYLR